MFILRHVQKNGLVVNQQLGDAYEYAHRDTHYDLFSAMFKECMGYDHVADLDDKATEATKNTACMLFADGKYIPLWYGEKYYVMSESGKTFERINVF